MKNWAAKRSVLANTALVVLTTTLLASPALATGTLGLDVATLNQLLPALTAEEFEVTIMGGQTVTLRLEELEITGFDPAAGGESAGRILTRVRVAIVDLGFKTTIRPSLSLHVLERDKQSLLVMRFEQAEITLPLLGDVDIGRLIPPLEFPAESFFELQGATTNVPMRGWLTGVKMGQKVLQFAFELEQEGRP